MVDLGGIGRTLGPQQNLAPGQNPFTGRLAGLQNPFAGQLTGLQNPFAAANPVPKPAPDVNLGGIVGDVRRLAGPLGAWSPAVASRFRQQFIGARTDDDIRKIVDQGRGYGHDWSALLAGLPPAAAGAG